MSEYRMSQKEFAQVLGMSPSHYNMYETGRNIPYIEQGLTMAKKLNKSLEEIYFIIDSDITK